MTDVSYTCRYCRQASDASSTACPWCGAPVDLRATVTASGWTKQPAIKDLARIQFGQSRVQIEGRQVPTADFALSGQEWIYFSHHSLLWADESTQMQAMSLSGGWQRKRAGLPIVMMQASGPGHIALSENQAGELLAIPLQHNQQMWVREHRFLTATGNVTYSWENQPAWYTTRDGDEQETHYPLGYIGDIFTAQQGPGLLLLHAPGNVFIRDLADEETMLIQPGALVYRDMGVSAYLHIEYPRSNVPGLGRIMGDLSNKLGGLGGNLGALGGLAGKARGRAFGGLRGMIGDQLADSLGSRGANVVMGGGFSHRTVWLRLTGPGRVAIQSVYEREESSDYVQSSSPATTHYW
jgi:uncharacterized protein (AIM24 family)